MAQTGINPKQIKSYNDTALLYLLCSQGPLSRKDIAAKLELTAAAVSKITKRLIDNGKIREIGESSKNNDRAGRKEVLLAINSENKLVLGITAELDSISFSICDVGGKLYNLKTIAFTDDIEAIVEQAKQFTAYNNVRKENIIGIGLCVVGAVENNAYSVWDNKRLIFALEEAFRLPVAVENNVKSYALAELMYGQIPDEVVLFFKWGNGIGSAVTTGGRVLSKNTSAMTEIGHYIVDPTGKKCRCGRYGCLETFASAKALSEQAGGMRLDQIIKSEDEEIISVVDHVIDDVALALANTSTILDARKIVLFGSMFTNDSIAKKVAKQIGRYNVGFDTDNIAVGKFSSKSNYIAATAVGAREFFYRDEN